MGWRKLQVRCQCVFIQLKVTVSRRIGMPLHTVPCCGVNPWLLEHELNNALFRTLRSPAFHLVGKPLGILLTQLKRRVRTHPLRGVVHSGQIGKLQLCRVSFDCRRVGLFHTNRLCRISKRCRGSQVVAHQADLSEPTVSHRRRPSQHVPCAHA